MRNPQSVPQGALCALHPTEYATLSCARCGNFMCEVCSESLAQSLCPTCRALGGEQRFALERSTYDFGTLFSVAFEAFKREWLMLSVAVIIFYAAYFVVAIIGQVLIGIATAMVAAIPGDSGKLLAGVLTGLLALATSLGSVVTFGVLKLGFDRLCADALEGRKVDLARMFRLMRKAGTYLLHATLGMVAFTVIGVILVAVAVLGVVSVTGKSAFQGGYEEALPMLFAALGLASLLGALPLGWLWLGYQNASFEVMYTRADALEAIRNGFTLASGHRLNGLLVLLVSIPLTFVGLLACGIGFIPAFVLITLLQVGQYLAMRNGAGLTAEPDGG
jgi:hypothetical protein